MCKILPDTLLDGHTPRGDLEVNPFAGVGVVGIRGQNSALRLKSKVVTPVGTEYGKYIIAEILEDASLVCLGVDIESNPFRIEACGEQS